MLIADLQGRLFGDIIRHAEGYSALILSPDLALKGFNHINGLLVEGDGLIRIALVFGDKPDIS